MIIEKERLLKRLDETEYSEAEYTVSPSKKDGFTVLRKTGNSRFYINSTYDPVKAGAQYAESVLAHKGDTVIYGLGLGYHIKALADTLLPSQTLYVFEASMVLAKIAFELTDIAEVLEREGVVFLCTDSVREIAVRLDRLVNAEKNKLFIYEPALRFIPDSMEALKDTLERYRASEKMLGVFSDRMKENSEANIRAGYRNGLKLFKDAFKGFPAIVVSAGASLSLNVEALKSCADKAVVVCITRAAVALYDAGIEPDFYISTDSGNFLKQHLDFESGKLSKPLFLLSTADKNAASYKGEKLIIFENGAVPENEREYSVETGGSVATTNLSLCALLGANPIVLFGQDLCYCLSKTHSDGRWDTVEPSKAQRYVLANDGNKYQTNSELHFFRKWIEGFIRRNKQISFYNATALGAVIDGAPNIEPISFFSEYPNIRNEIEKIKAERGVY